MAKTSLSPDNNNISFTIADQEMVKLCANGDIYVKGKLTENDKELVDGLREFLKIATQPIEINNNPKT